MDIRPLQTDREIDAAFPLMAELRDRVRRATFVSEVRREQAQDYELIGAFDGQTLVALAGVRRTHTLARGDHVFVDDLVTSPHARGAGHGRALMRWVIDRAARDGVPRVYLDARITAKGFYEKLGFTFLTSVPCWIDVPAAKGDRR
jgi:GNAT superfamily N-acetyltransferase